MNIPANRDGRVPARFEALDGWRGLAALMVALFHAPFDGMLYQNPLVRNSYLWVDFFFVLSGFVITHAAAGGLSSGRAVTSFLLRRFGRVWPLHAAVLGAFFLLELAKFVGARGGIALQHQPFSGGHSIDSLFANLALVQSLGIYAGTTWNTPSWSICVEFWTYIVFALLLWRQPHRLLPIAVAICAVSGLALALVSATRPYADITFDFGIVRCAFGFFLGHLTYRLAIAKPLALSGAAAASLELAAVSATIAFVCSAGVYLPPAAGAPVFAAAIYVFAAEAGPVSRLLRSPGARSLGLWSYSIYMTHLLVITVVLQTVHAVEKVAHAPLLRSASATDPDVLAIALPGSMWWGDAATLLYLAITLAVSWWSFRWIEAPGRSVFADIARRRAAEPAGLMPVAAPVSEG